MKLNRLKVYLSHFVSFLTDEDFRKEYWLFVTKRKHYHQTLHDTALNRYPELFEICKNYFERSEKVAILSFGCSTGEEVASINQYLPQAFVTGTDISEVCLKKCNQHFKNDRNRFINSLSEEFVKSENFDAIFCLAVFQRPQTVPKKSLKTITNYPFDQFNKKIIDLDTKLNVGGLLFIDRCDFRFLDTETSARYAILNVTNNKIIRDRPVFNATNERHDLVTDAYRVFIKKNKPLTN